MKYTYQYTHKIFMRVKEKNSAVFIQNHVSSQGIHEKECHIRRIFANIRSKIFMSVWGTPLG